MAQQQAAVCTQVRWRHCGGSGSGMKSACSHCCITLSPSPSPPPQLHPPTAVTQCASAWLTRPQQLTQGGGSSSSGGLVPDLVVVCSTQLEVFAVRTDGVNAAGAPIDSGAAEGPAAAASGLELLASSQLFGVVESVAVLRAQAPGQRDALLLTFR